MLSLKSVNLGSERSVGKVVSGIFKRAVSKPVQLTRNGLVGDVVSDTKHHGGPDQAVYVYGEEDYLWWQRELGFELLPGTFGDNLTIAHLSCGDVHVGDRFTIAEEIFLEVSAPRIPCATLGRRMEDKHFPLKFRRAERPGFYCRVLREGEVMSDSVVEHLPYQKSPRFSIVDMFRHYYDPQPQKETLEAMLEVPLAIRERKRIESKLGHL